MHTLVSTIDSDRFGFKIAKLGNDVIDPYEVVSDLKKSEVRLIIARVELRNIELITKLERLGFEYKDAQLTFSFDLVRDIPNKETNSIVMHSYMDKYHDKLIQITQQSFQNYGHYYADERLDKAKCNEIYTDLIHRCCVDEAVSDHMIVAVLNGEPIGYLAFRTQNLNLQKHLVGVIGAVSPKHRQLGVFRLINIESINNARDMNATTVQNNVLVTNFPVMKTYTSLSYRIIRSEITMHLWLT